MSLKNSSTNPAQAQMTKARTKRNFKLPKRRTKSLHKHKIDQTTETTKKERKILQNLLQPLKTNNPDRSVSLCLDHQTQSLQLHPLFSGLPLTKKNVDLQHLNFSGLPLTHHPKKNVDHPQSFTEAEMTLRRSQSYSHLNGSKKNSKKRNLGLKPTITARLKTL